MIVLTTPIIRRITKLRVTGVAGLDDLDDTVTAAVVNIEAGSPAGVTETARIHVTDTTSTGVREATGPAGDDLRRGGLLSGVTVPTPGGLTPLRAAVAGASGKAAKLAAVEAWLLSVPGLVPAGTLA